MPEFIKDLLRSNPARFVSYGTVAAIWLAVKGSELLGVPIAADSEVALAVGTIAAAIVTEVIRRLVYSPKTVEAVASSAAATGDPTVRTSPP